MTKKPTNRRIVTTTGSDFYPTPAWATRALMESEIFLGDIWEPACGTGDMSRVIEDYGFRVKSTDLNDYGYGTPNINFLHTDDEATNVITNPPYNLAQEFIEKSLLITRKKSAFLMRLAFLEGVNRQQTLFTKNPPARVWVFSERITFYPAGVKKGGSGTTAYAWFVWDKDHSGETVIKWLKPGFKSRDG